MYTFKKISTKLIKVAQNQGSSSEWEQNCAEVNRTIL